MHVLILPSSQLLDFHGSGDMFPHSVIGIPGGACSGLSVYLSCQFS